ncbi:MAG: AMP-binding protein [Deltaproteobacteria bacterium]|jgi:long-chain acyl-CoA synthetase|nr:AMP-binding protein [Deltaproteobacteria bacterium]MBT4268422.1 AMP-binding protein [Deltaproteobacteria bacterium]MBT4642668.1 AMP-binding protein [Deltaproteobacteria bacterium]
MNIAKVFAETAGKDPEKTMFIYGDKHYTFGQIEELSSRFASGLSNFGVKKGDVVSLGLPNCPEFVIVLLGIAKIGAVTLPLNPMLKHKELSFIFGDCKVRCAVTFEGHARIIGTLQESKEDDFFMIGLSGGEEGIRSTISDLASTNPLQKLKPAPIFAKDLFLIVYTSGTTGHPKGVMLGHDNVLAVAGAVAQCHGCLDQDDRYVCFFPLTHITGIVNFLVNGFLTGSSMVLMKRFDLGEYLNCFDQHKATVMGAVTPVFMDILAIEDLDQYDFDSLKRITSGGASLPAALYQRLEKQFGVPILEMYGMTENAATLTSNPLYRQKMGSVGVVLDGMAVKVTGEGGEELLPGSIGEILAKGKGVMKGYLNKPGLTQKTLGDSWYHTGDLGKIDEDGFLYIVDRKDDMINAGAFKIYPREVEEAILKHPEVADCAVIKQEDERMGQIPAAFVVLKIGAGLTEESLKEFSRKSIANYKVPRRFNFIDELPRNAQGKILKRELH